MKTYMARQPIFDVRMNVYAYELLYRGSMVNAFDPSVDGDAATQRVVSNTLTTFGQGNILNGRRAFINFSRSLLLSDFADLLNPKDFAIEVLETVRADDAVLSRLQELRERGFLLALDDYIGEASSEPFLPLVHIVKVDFRDVPPERHAALAGRLSAYPVTLLAEKVETQEEFQRAQKDGYRLFQGYFFAKPTVFSKQLLSLSTVTYMRAIKEVISPLPDFDRITSIIRSDITLAYKLLQHVNTMQYSHYYQINNIKQAIVQMGVQNVYRWLLLVLMQDVASVSNDEFSKLAFIRGIFCSKVCAQIGLKFENDEAYTAGMFSIIDLMLDGDLNELLSDIALPQPVLDALLREDNELSSVLSLAKAYERGDWDFVIKFLYVYDLSEEQLSGYYTEAVLTADQAFETGRESRPPIGPVL